MAFPEAFIEELVSRSEISDVVGSYVALTKRSGSNIFGLCPFHNEKTPSFSVSTDKQIYHCFGCGKGGGVIGFIMEIENLSFPDAVAFLARRANMIMPEEENDRESSRRQVLLELNRAAARFYYTKLTEPGGAPARAYIQKRGISPAVAKNFGLGYAPDSWSALTDAMMAKGFTQRDLVEAGLAKHGRNGGVYDAFRNRLMFPVIDVRGSVIGFSGRLLGDDGPKYLNSPETPVFSKSSNLFGLNLAKKSKSGYIILVEGNVDVVALHQAGFDSAVASLGTSLTDEQARLISRYVNEVVLCYDSDEAGKKAAQRAIAILDKLDLKVRVLQLPGAKDPDEYIQKNGPDAFRNLLEGSAGQVEYRLRLIEDKHPMLTDEDRLDYLKEAETLLATLPMPAQRELYAARVADRAGVRREGVLQDVENLRKRRMKSAKKQEARDNQPMKTLQPANREFRYEDPVSARAEEGLIRLLYLDPGLARKRELPTPDKFTSPLLGRFYTELLRRIGENAPISTGVLTGQFTGDEMSHFITILNKEEDLSNGERALSDYIDTIISRQTDREADLAELAKKYRQTKGYGGQKT